MSLASLLRRGGSAYLSERVVVIRSGRNMGTPPPSTTLRPD